MGALAASWAQIGASWGPLGLHLAFPTDLQLQIGLHMAVQTGLHLGLRNGLQTPLGLDLVPPTDLRATLGLHMALPTGLPEQQHFIVNKRASAEQLQRLPLPTGLLLDFI